MAKRFKPDSDQVETIKSLMKQNVSFYNIAKVFGINEDTLKRFLVKEGLAVFGGDKFLPSNREEIKKWNRPCMRCGCTKSRPKNQYICDPCKSSTEEHEGLPNGWEYEY